MTIDNNVAFIIGNGISRKGFDLNKLKDKTTIGCNGIYNEFTPKFIVAIDDVYIDILYNSDFPQHRLLIPPEYERFEMNNSGRRSNAGMNAMLEAIKKGNTTLYCLGFDFLIKDKDKSLSNIFEGQEGYGPETKANYTDNLNRVQYLNWFTKQYPDIEFIFVLPRSDLEIHDLTSPNISGIFYDDFEKEVLV